MPTRTDALIYACAPGFLLISPPVWSLRSRIFSAFAPPAGK
ncbi:MULTISPECIES: hypothetical protein [Rahnella]|nr:MULTISPECIES: hypothetical protein [Rahnella]MCS3424372.1 hypothetical protein [Rahnella sp. BIGb0603]MDF1895007.1 hypothetical protein [Rahnella contaminans]